MIDTEKLRKVASFQDFAEHADLILAAAMTIDDQDALADKWEREASRIPHSASDFIGAGIRAAMRECAADLRRALGGTAGGRED